MSLTNLEPVATAAAATVLDPILYDSGWKIATGVGSTTTHETMKYDVDTIVRVFGRRSLIVRGGEWFLSFTGADGGAVTWQQWRNIEQPWITPVQGTSQLDEGADYEIVSNATVFQLNQSINTQSVTGWSLGANQSLNFRSTAGAAAADAIQYRIIVERSTSAVMLSRAIGKPQ